MHFNVFFSKYTLKLGMSILFCNKHNNCMVVQYCYLLNNKVPFFAFKILGWEGVIASQILKVYF